MTQTTEGDEETENRMSLEAIIEMAIEKSKQGKSNSQYFNMRGMQSTP